MASAFVGRRLNLISTHRGKNLAECVKSLPPATGHFAAWKYLLAAYGLTGRKEQARARRLDDADQGVIAKRLRRRFGLPIANCDNYAGLRRRKTEACGLRMSPWSCVAGLRDDAESLSRAPARTTFTRGCIAFSTKKSSLPSLSPNNKIEDTGTRSTAPNLSSRSSLGFLTPDSICDRYARDTSRASDVLLRSSPRTSRRRRNANPSSNTLTRV